MYSDQDLQLICSQASSSDVQARIELSKWGHLPSQVVRKLAFDEDATVRTNVAATIGLNDTVLFPFLAADKVPAVRINAAFNEACPREITTALLADRNKDVKFAAMTALVRDTGFQQDGFVVRPNVQATISAAPRSGLPLRSSNQAASAVR